MFDARLIECLVEFDSPHWRIPVFSHNVVLIDRTAIDLRDDRYVYSKQGHFS